MANNEEMELMMLDGLTLKAVTDAYATLAGVANGYTNALVKKGGLTREEAKQRFLKIDKKARDMVGEALTAYLSEKGSDEP